MDKPSFFIQTYIRIALFFQYIWACIKYWAIPWNYFVLNSQYFNEAKGIFSKLEMDILIPKRHRLHQYYYDPKILPSSYPVFIKPEWGQNSKGIICVKNNKDYQAVQSVTRDTDMPFIVQEVALGKNEFEIYYLRSPENSGSYAFLSITQVINHSQEDHPINSIHNPHTFYREITHIFSAAELEAIWVSLGQIGKFRMARIGLKADDIKGILQNHFKIVEINLFLPMPLVLLAENIDLYEKNKIIKKTMSFAAKLVKIIPENETEKKIFFQKMKAHYKVTP